MMRIALVAPPYESVPPLLYGGTERVVGHLAGGLTDAGFEVTVFASGDSRPWKKKPETRQPALGRLVPIVDQALRLRDVPPKDSSPYHFRTLREVAHLAHEFDIIHNHDDYWMFPLSMMAKAPILTTVHGRLDLPDIKPAYEAYPAVYFVSISDSQRLQMPHLPWIRTIHHGINTDHLRFNPHPGKYLAFLGRMTEEKRPEWAIEIARSAGVPLKIAAKIEGSEGRAYYDARIRPFVDGKWVEYVGEISEAEKSDFLGNALALVFPIDWPEPFGLVMIESLACGTPVLARSCGAAVEILEEGVTGFCSLDIQELARRVPDLLSVDRRACRRRVSERFSMKRMVEDYIDVYRNLAVNAPARIHSHPRLEPASGSDRYRRDFLYPLERAADGSP